MFPSAAYAQFTNVEARVGSTPINLPFTSAHADIITENTYCATFNGRARDRDVSDEIN